MTCSDCGKPIADGEQVCLWIETPGGPSFRFICDDCSKSDRYQQVDPASER